MRTISIARDRQFDLTKLPINNVNWEFDDSSAVLLVHDMQKYFIEQFPESEKNRIQNNIRKLVAYAKTVSMPVAYSGQSGLMTMEDRGLMADFWGAGMRFDYDEHNWVEEIEPAAEDLVLTKTRYSAFHATQLLTWIEQKKRDQLVLCGVYAHVGILSTALDAFTNNIKPFLVADSIGDMTSELYEFALRQAVLTCAMVVCSDAIIKYD